ncbi:branched-chain amino acid ABC transporter permease [Brevibacillus sp. NRS-1366]|uniref:branched-chain amino acid ABC transporter permease n=1 Tax=Brevibacillus sp. NRS-1366 TaxID=3233899 RepID=UPI003D222C17
MKFFGSKTNVSLAVFFLLALILPLLVDNKYYMNIFILVLFFAGISGSWNILAGYSGQLSLGHSIFFGLGQYTSTLLLIKLGVSPWIGMLAALVLCMIVGALIGYPCFRLKGPFFTLATLAFLEVIRLLVSYFKDFTSGAVGLNIPFKPGWGMMMFRGKEEYYYIALGILFVVLAVTYWIDRSKIGAYLIAIRENEEAAEMLGIPISRYKMYAVLISSGLAGITGVFYAQYLLFVEPASAFDMNLSIQVALIAIIGGMGTVLGPVIGAILMVPLNEVLRSTFSGYNGLNFFIYGIVLILVVSFIPNGILPTISDKYKSYKQRRKKATEIAPNVQVERRGRL